MLRVEKCREFVFNVTADDRPTENSKWALKGSGVPRNFVRGGGVQQIQLWTEDREKGDLGAVAP